MKKPAFKKFFALVLACCLSAAPMVAAEGSADALVYITETGAKYHSKTICRGLSNAKSIISTTESDAIARGLTKCSICWDVSPAEASLPSPENLRWEGYAANWGSVQGATYYTVALTVQIQPQDGSPSEYVTMDGILTEATAYDFTGAIEECLSGFSYSKDCTIYFGFSVAATDGDLASDTSYVSTFISAGYTHIHDYSQTVVEATCTKDGQTTYLCKGCRASYSEAIPALGHDYVAMTVQPTIFKAGKETKVCSRCGDTQTTVLPKLPSSVEISSPSAKLKVGKTLRIKIKKKSSGDSVKSWKSSNTKIATVNSNGKIVAKKPGTAVITLAMKSGCKAKCKVTVK